MTRGRPPEGPNLVNNMDGSDPAKDKSRIILGTVTGEWSVEDACRELGIGKTAFHAMRKRALQAMVDELEPKSPGRPRKDPDEESELDQLRREVFELRFMQRAAQVREQIALTMPHLLTGDPIPDTPPNTKKKGTVRHQQKRRQTNGGKKNT